MAYNEKNAKAYQERAQFETNYYHGLCTETAVGQQYANLLSQYKHALNAELSSFHGAVDAYGEIGNSSNRKNFIVLGIAAVIWLFAFHILNLDLGPQFAAFLVAVICMAVTMHDGGWAIAPFIAYFALCFFGVQEIAMIGTLIFYAVKVCRLGIVTKSKTDTYVKNVNNSAELRDQLRNLKEQMKSDLDAWQQGWYQRNSSVLRKEDRKDYLGDDFPPAFWWEMDYDEVNKMEEVFDCDLYGSWENRLIQREAGTEFDADGEFAPLRTDEIPYKEQLDTYRRRNCVVFDVISRLNEIVGARENTVQYQVPAHGSMEIFSRRMGVLSLANEIDQSYNKGYLSGAEHTELAYNVSALSFLTEEWAGQTKTESYTEYIPIRAHANIWTGQFVLAPTGNNTYRLEQYYCQLPHMIENLKCLRAAGKDVRYIDIDWFQNIPFFLNKFFTYYPNAY